MPAGAVIDTFVEGDPGSCRETAEWLGRLSSGCHDIGTGLHRSRSESVTIWQGEAGESFRGEMRGNAGDADVLAEYFERSKVALEKFAAELDTVRSKVEQARGVAVQHGLTVTPTTIESPGPEPPKMPVEGPGTAVVERTPAEEHAVAEYQAKAKAFSEVGVTVHEARRIEQEAHEDLKSGLKMTKSLLEALVPQGWSWAPVATGSYSGAYVTAKALDKVAQTAQSNADGYKSLLADPTFSQADRQQILRNHLDWEGKARPAASAAQSAQGLDGVIPGDDRLKGVLGKTVKGAGVVGIAATANSVRQDIEKGVPADKAVTKGTASTAASAGVGAGMTALAAAGYIGGVAATGGTLLIGTAVAAGVGWAVDNYYDDVKNWLTE